MASICGSPVCAGGKPQLKFTYTGDYVVRKDGVVELLTSGTLVFLEPKVIDVFMVGGGGKGGLARVSSSDAGGGGGGGFTRTIKKLSVSGSYDIVIGNGSTALSTPGGPTSFGSAITVAGGNSGGFGSSNSNRNGQSGGSGGGGCAVSASYGGVGGNDGSNGDSATGSGGAGQGSTTREFGELTGKLYAGGGGGGRYFVSATPVVSMGGAGGGGSGAWAGSYQAGQGTQAPAAGIANTGGGGGGGVETSGYGAIQGASGGSGIVCFRDAAKLPELAGTWVLNERLYAPESAINENINFTGKELSTSTSRNFTGVQISTKQFDATPTGSLPIVIYKFAETTWVNKYKYLTFPAGATASDEFRAWLASNASKQA